MTTYPITYDHEKKKNTFYQSSGAGLRTFQKSPNNT